MPDFSLRWSRAVLLCCMAAAQQVHASHLIQVQDSAGQPVADAVVYAETAGGPVVAKNANAEIQQKDKKFIPLVSVVQTGTSVSFPNNDTVRHHAYSFSPTKPFELKLYSGKPSSPVVFDKAGTVVIGCNIHDQMVAYVQVVSTPFFAKTDANGQAHLPASMPVGKYTLKTWHFKQPNNSLPQEQSVQVGNDTVPLIVKLGYKAI